MPPTTRKTPAHRTPSGGSSGRQATLSFHHRVTKPAAAKHSAKEAAVAALPTAKAEEPKKASAAKKDKAEAETQETETEDDGKVEQAPTPAQEDDDSAKTETDTYPVAVNAAPTCSKAEIEAETEAKAVSDAQIRRYWRGIEAQTVHQQVHQEGVDVGEKVLRYFDVSSHFGPCVGITRKNRWLRAQRLGLAPPIEVLAALQQEEAKGVDNVERSTFDTILNTTTAT
ncbi:DNA polymerase delta subunit [Niveomyces insectorum RCEF 264]|uniref:DNA polymerase delta subunit n=1 Tax=Niveomyces insectorum RCEF 264 TaxID=1081102 RepID=A0A167QA28_9HYPO|nr:DNA polymerase delta subunit [Niveomyces insectorum RCEF 264]